MPTTASSNNPHVRIRPNTHEKVRLLAFVLKITQGDLIDLLTDEKLEALGNPRIHVPMRQARKEEPVGVPLTGPLRRRSSANTARPSTPPPVEKPKRRSRTAV